MPEIKFIVFAQGRTGSSLLRSMLYCHTSIRCDDEILLPPPPNPVDFIQQKCVLCKHRAYGFKFKAYHSRIDIEQRGIEHRAVLKRFNDLGWKIIYLRRDNIFRHALSTVIADQRKVYVQRIESELAKLKVDCDRLAACLRKRQEMGCNEKLVLDGLEHHDLVYERDLLTQDRHQETMDGVFEFLDVDPHTVVPDTYRITSDDISEFVENEDEVIETVRDCGFGKYLNT